MNLARYWETALASEHLGEILVYFIGPAIGAVIAWAVYAFVLI